MQINLIYNLFSGRQVSELFVELPANQDYPDYYEVIKQPIALGDIQLKIRQGEYEDLEGVKVDFRLMVDNAKTYNMKSSWVYKDAVTLLRIFESQFGGDAASGSGTGSDVGRPARTSSAASAASDLIKRSLDAVLNMDDEVVEVFSELPSAEIYPDYYDVVKRPISLVEIGDKVKSRAYKHINDLDKDVTLMVENAKTYNEPDSAVYEAAEQLLATFRAAAGLGTRQTVVKRAPNELDYCTHNGIKYRVGDFAYLVNEDNHEKPIIAQIYRIWTNGSGDVMLQANWYLRPEQTVHPKSRRFFPKEVFKWDRFVEHVKTDLLGQCLVMHIKDFMKGRPEGWSLKEREPDIWVCESQYFEASKKIEKIKNWRQLQPEELKHVEVLLYAVYDSPMMLEKVPSPFADGTEGPEEAEVVEEEQESSSDADSDINTVIVKRKRGRPRKDASALPPPPKERRTSRIQRQQHERIATMHSTIATNATISSQYQQNQALMKNFSLQMQQQQQSLASQQQMLNMFNAYNMQAKAMAPPSITTRVTKTMSPLKLSLPESLPQETASHFRKNDDGKIAWFMAPPRHILPRHQPTHSVQYLKWKSVNA